MNPITRIAIPVTVDAAGAGTATAGPVCGRVVEVRMPNAGTALTDGGTADFTLVRATDGGTILTVSNASAPFEYHPAQAVHSTSAGTSAYNTGVGPVYVTAGVPVDDYITLTVAQAAASASGTVYVHVEGRAY